jgi:hemerythrin HHE cation binding domain-containing protein
LTFSPERLTAFGDQLIAIHTQLRKDLTRLRAGYGAAERPRDLRTHCVAFCSALTKHHTGEDKGAFVALGEQFPQLQPVLQQLTEDHDMVAWILLRIQELLDGDGDPVATGRELDGLAAILESHFVYEEKKIVEALNSLDAGPATTEDLLGVSVDRSGK